VRNEEIHVELQRIQRSLDNVLCHLEQLPVLDAEGEIQTLDDSLWRLRKIGRAANEQREELEEAPAP